eukprot:19645-Heterococcus_DN1.PRE.2
MWNPEKGTGSRDLIATSGDHLRLWRTSDSVKNGVVEYCSPLTSFDWSEADPNTIGTSSIDTTCTIWDVTTGSPRTQLIAHDKEVFDMAFSRDKEVFASVGADGSVRMFDLRSLEHSTIIYETPDLVPLLRLAWNKQDPNYLATIMVDSAKTLVLDIRVPSVPKYFRAHTYSSATCHVRALAPQLVKICYSAVLMLSRRADGTAFKALLRVVLYALYGLVAELESHTACVNAVAWAPHSCCHVCTVADDKLALIWDTSSAVSHICNHIFTNQTHVYDYYITTHIVCDVQALCLHRCAVLGAKKAAENYFWHRFVYAGSHAHAMLCSVSQRSCKANVVRRVFAHRASTR